MHHKDVIAIVAGVLVIIGAAYLLFFNGVPLTAVTTTTSIYKTTTTAKATTSTVSSTTTTTVPYNLTEISASSSTSPLIKVAIRNYLAPYCQGSSQAPIGENGIPCAQEVNSTASTFNSTSGAFDCAGFIQYIYSQFGVKLPVTAQAQFGNFYPADDKVVPVLGGQANTIPGDMVYFSIPGDHDPEPAHVAMCFVAGCNEIIQNGGPHFGMPGSIAPLNALVCSNPNSSTSKCIMGFDEVQGFNYTTNSIDKRTG